MFKQLDQGSQGACPISFASSLLTWSFTWAFRLSVSKMSCCWAWDYYFMAQCFIKHIQEYMYALIFMFMTDLFHILQGLIDFSNRNPVLSYSLWYLPSELTFGLWNISLLMTCRYCLRLCFLFFLTVCCVLYEFYWTEDYVLNC